MFLFNHRIQRNLVSSFKHLASKAVNHFFSGNNKRNGTQSQLHIAKLAQKLALLV